MSYTAKLRLLIYGRVPDHNSEESRAQGAGGLEGGRELFLPPRVVRLARAGIQSDNVMHAAALHWDFFLVRFARARSYDGNSVRRLSSRGSRGILRNEADVRECFCLRWKGCFDCSRGVVRG